MRRFVHLMCGLVVLCGVSAAAAGKAPTADDLDKSMKKTGAAQQALQKAVAAGNAAEAKTQVKALKTALTEAQEFWTANKVDEAATMGKAVLAKVDGVEKLVNAPTLDTAAVNAANRDLSTSCGTCHRAYRTTNEDNQFVLKPGVIPGAAATGKYGK